jgi:hypothetical protein
VITQTEDKECIVSVVIHIQLVVRTHPKSDLPWVTPIGSQLLLAVDNSKCGVRMSMADHQNAQPTRRHQAMLTESLKSEHNWVP